MKISNQTTHYVEYNGPLGNGDTNNHIKRTIAVSGTNETGICGAHAFDQGKELGREIIRQGGVLITGAGLGFPSWSAIGAKEEHGMSIGVSPAANQKEHIHTYHLPLEHIDLMIYTGFGAPGVDLLLARNCDALIVGCGRISNMYEFSIALEEGKPIGILEGEWTAALPVRKILEQRNRTYEMIVFDTDPKALVEKLMALVEKKKK
jgi:uncharacterized protein (TIGR00725 family)